MQPVTLKGTQNGYKLIIDQSSGIKESLLELDDLLSRLDKENSNTSKDIKLDVLTGNRLLSDKDIANLKKVFDKHSNFAINQISSNVVTSAKAHQLQEHDSVHAISRTIRNGQECKMHGDVLFFGSIHKGGKLYTDGNIYLMGNVEGVVHAGYPNSENKLIIGDLHNAQQVRIGEQFDVVADRQIPASSRTVAYVNDLHVLSYGKLANLRHINPKFYNQIGGVM